MTQKGATLSELFPNWGKDQPQTLIELVNADYGSLDPVSADLRSLAVALAHSFERDPVLTAADARRLLEKHHLPARRQRWSAVVLDEKRERHYVRRAGAGMRLLHTVTRDLPDRTLLDDKAPLPDNGRWLLIWGGGVDALTDENFSAYQTLTPEHQVADLILWDQSDTAAAFWSVRSGVGVKNGQALEFPDDCNLRRWQAWQS